VSGDLARLIAEAQVLAGAPHPCQVLGHRWVFHGGASCCCEDAGRATCSVPVHRCDACGDYDYGDNAEAAEIRRCCEEKNRDNDS